MPKAKQEYLLVDFLSWSALGALLLFLFVGLAEGLCAGSSGGACQTDSEGVWPGASFVLSAGISGVDLRHLLPTETLLRLPISTLADHLHRLDSRTEHSFHTQLELPCTPPLPQGRLFLLVMISTPLPRLMCLAIITFVGRLLMLPAEKRFRPIPMVSVSVLSDRAIKR